MNFYSSTNHAVMVVFVNYVELSCLKLLFYLYVTQQMKFYTVIKIYCFNLA